MVYQIDPRTTALLLIDVQREYVDEDRALYTGNARTILAHLVALRAAAHRVQMPTVFIRHVHAADGSDVGRIGDVDPTPVFVVGTPGVDIIPALTPREGDIVIDKTRYSAFVGTPLASVLETIGVDTLIVTGLMTNYCSVTTARHAMT